MRAKPPRSSSDRNHKPREKRLQKPSRWASNRRAHRASCLFSPAVPTRGAAVETPVSPKQPTMPEIPVSQFERIRTWVKYGMTVSQVAQVYTVTVEEIERILRKA